MIKIVLLKKKIAEVINRHLIWYVQCTYIQLVLFFSLDNIKTIKNLKDATKWKKPLLKFFLIPKLDLEMLQVIKTYFSKFG